MHEKKKETGVKDQFFNRAAYLRITRTSKVPTHWPEQE